MNGPSACESMDAVPSRTNLLSCTVVIQWNIVFNYWSISTFDNYKRCCPDWILYEDGHVHCSPSRCGWHWPRCPCGPGCLQSGLHCAWLFWLLWISLWNYFAVPTFHDNGRLLQSNLSHTWSTCFASGSVDLWVSQSLVDNLYFLKVIPK